MFTFYFFCKNLIGKNKPIIISHMVLGDDELFVIFSYLSPKDLCLVSLCSKSLHKISSCKEIWKKFCNETETEKILKTWNVNEYKLLYILAQNPKNDHFLIHFVSMFQKKYQTTDYNKLTRNQVKEMITDMALYYYMIPDQMYQKNLDEDSHEWTQTIQNCKWTFTFEWFSNNCTLNAYFYQYDREIFKISEEKTVDYVLKLKNWKFSFEKTEKDIKSLSTHLFESLVKVIEFTQGFQTRG